MYFITEKESETGKKFQEVLKKKDRAFEERVEFCNKYGFSQFRKAYWSAWGGISSCINFDEKVNTKLWKTADHRGEYMPKLNSKEGKAIDKEIQELTVVSRKELNSCIGFTSAIQHSIGFSAGSDKYFGFSVGEKWKVTPPEDCEEVTTTKYNSIFK